MSFKKYQLNKSLLGDFGEFVYREYAKKKQFEVKQTNIAETDVELIKNNRSYFVDVKSTWSKQGGYKGPRSRDNVSYDQVYINDDYIKIFPDKNSPLKINTEIVIEDTDLMLHNWKNKKPNKEKKNNLYQDYRSNLKKKLKLFFEQNSLKARIVLRGSVSLTKWSAKPDNLPGSTSVIKKYLFTIFIQLKYKSDNEEEISNIFLIPHDQLNKNIKLVDSDKRQKRKGIFKVIDFDHFKQNNEDLMFDSIEKLKKKLLLIKHIKSTQ